MLNMAVETVFEIGVELNSAESFIQMLHILMK